MAWLAEDADLISIRAREPEDQRMFLTGRQQLVVFVTALLLLARPVRGARHRELVARVGADGGWSAVRSSACWLVLAVALGLGAYIYFSRASRSRSPRR